MSSVVAIVKSIVGQVFAVSSDGLQRLLVEGDRLFKGDQVLTGDAGMVSLELADGRTLDLGRDSQWSEGDTSVHAQTQPTQAQTEAPATDVAQLQKAIEAGVDPTQALEATAAGPGAGNAGGNTGGVGGGHSFVMLDATAGRVDANIGFETGAIPPVAEAQEVDDSSPLLNAPAVEEVPAAPNNAPQGEDASITTDEDTPIQGQVTAADQDGDSLTFSLGNNPGNGTVVVKPDGSYVYTPNPDFNGNDSFTVIVDDGNGGTDTITVSIGVNPVNDAPVALNDGPTAVTEDTPATGNVLTNDSDVDGDTLTVTQFTIGGSTFQAGQTAVIEGIGSLVINADGSYSFTPAPNYTGPVPTATYTVTDGTATDTADLSFADVTPVNDAPVALNDGPTAVTEDTPATGNVLTNDSDVDGDPLTVTQFTIGESTFQAGQTAVINGVGSLVINADGSYSFTPAPNYTGPVPTATYTVTDGTATDTADLSFADVTPVNDAPVALNDGPTAVTEDTPATGNVLTNDSDVDGDPLTVTQFTIGESTFQAGQTAVINGVGSLVINADGSYSFTPAPNYTGPVPTATYTVTDGTATDTADLSFADVSPVNDAPVALNDGPTAVTEDTPATGNVLTNDSDVDGDTLTVTQFTIGESTFQAGQTAVIKGVGSLVINADGSYSFTPAPDYTGPVPTATYTVTDGTATDTADLSFADVTPVNDASILVADSKTVAEDNPATGNVLANDSDVDDVLTVATFSIDGVQGTFTAGTTATIGQIGSLVINTDGTYVFTPAPNWNGEVPEVSYTTNTGSSSTLTITVTPENDAPETNATSASGNEDAEGIPVVLSGSDVDGSVDHFVIKSLPSNGTLLLDGVVLGIGAVIPATANGATVTFVPDANWNGTTTVEYASVDNDGLEDSTPATATITVAPVNDAPVIDGGDGHVPDSNDFAITTDEDTPVTGTIQASDLDGDSLTYTVGTSPAHGSVTFGTDGAYTYTPGTDFNGSDSFTVTVSDGNGGTVTSTVNVTVKPVVDAKDDAVTVAEDQSLTTNVLANDTFGAGAQVTSVGTATHGTVTLNADGTVTYTPSANYNGPDSYTYTVTTAAGNQESATVNITVTPVNDAPVAVADTATVNEGGSVNISVANNDSDTDDGLDLGSITITSGPANGTVIVNANGTVSYQHNGSETTADSFTYTIKDKSGAESNPVTVNIGVTPVNDAPVAVADTAIVNEGGSVNINVAGNDTDADDGLDLTSITVTSGPANGTLTVNADGTVSYQHNGSETTADSFTYTIKDKSGVESNPVTVNIGVTPVNDAPVAVADSATVNEGGSVNISVASNDTDADDGLDLGSITITSGPANGTLTVNADGTVSYQHNGSETTEDSFTYTIKDKSGVESNPVTVSIGVTPVNNAPVAVADSATVNEGGSVNISVANNDSDADDGLDLTSITVTSGPANGTLTVNADGTVSYQHNGSETTADSFTYTIKDQSGAESNPVTVSIGVTPVNDAPVAVADTATVNEGGSVNINVAGNDSDADDGLDLGSIVIGTNPAHGTLTVNADGTVSYQHDGSETTADSFTYTIKDQSGVESNPVTVSIGVTPVNDAPVAVADTATVNEGGSVNINVASNDTDADDGLNL
ncbi:retention module-containing protein, partial [Pseudomonas sp. LFM046]|uniref:retention module-containing protein n=1 Tax=Pseudomonas sp. LFM046 TaxID=1608357 RepID=UPI000CCBD82C